MNKDGLLGLGEVGKAINQFFPDALIGTLQQEIEEPVEFLHVCIPWSEKFVEIVNGEDYQVAIIHSSVPVGTTEKIRNAVHSPIRGVHPHLYEGIKAHTKFVGANDVKLGIKAVRHLTQARMNVVLVADTKTTELGKLMDTTKYGIDIEIHRWQKELCDKYGVSFEDAVTMMDNAYNRGYQALGLSKFTRPLLTPPEGSIGGHCVRENAQFLPMFNAEMVWEKPQ
jgi:UDP-N-acetyl-D-mannosaminuronate dehydrogenase